MNLPGTVHQTSNIDELMTLLSGQIKQVANQRIADTGNFHLALSGGSTPRLLFNYMGSESYSEHFPWHSTHIWQVDERVVSLEDERLNWKMISANLIRKVKIPKNLLHPMPVLEQDGDLKYEASFRKHRGIPLDFILLGLGTDGHIASLFPQTPGLSVLNRQIVLNDGETVASPRPRMTMTFSILNSARQLAVLVVGKRKRKILEEISTADSTPKHYPILGVNNPNQEWFICLDC